MFSSSQYPVDVSGFLCGHGVQEKGVRCVSGVVGGCCEFAIEHHVRVAFT